MEQLIEALQIFLKYANPSYPTHCEHDIMYIMDVDVKDVSTADRIKLDELGFFWDDGEDGFISYKYGSA